MRNPSNIALIFFSRSAEEEAIAKKWLGKAKGKANVRIAKLLIAQTEVASKASSFDFLHFQEAQQRGKTFGEKLANAFSDVFAMGYSAAIAIGNDSPDIGQTNWEHVRLALESGKSVLGPTARGGSYLIGLQASSFEAAQFKALAWQSKQIFAQLKALFDENGILELQKLRDLNTLQDLKLTIRETDTQFSRLLKELLYVLRAEQRRPKPFIGNFFGQSQRVRPPPAAFA